MTYQARGCSPGERLIACRNPYLAAERARKREALLAATEAELAKIKAAVDSGQLTDPDKIGIRAGKVIDKRKAGKHFTLGISQGRLAWERNQAAIDGEAALDGIYVIRTSVPAGLLAAPGVVTAYKNLSRLERDFRTIKATDLDLRPIHHRLEDRVRAHVLICMLAAYLTWHLRAALAPLTYTDDQPPTRDNPVAPAGAQPRPTPRQPAMPAPTATRCGPSAACSTTSPPSPGQPSPSAASPSTSSASPPQNSGAPSTSSAPPSR